MVTIKQELIEVSNDDLNELDQLETGIETARRNAYYLIGTSLTKIKNKELYKIERSEPIDGHYSFETWEEYCQSRWGYEKSHVHRLIESAKAADKLKSSPIGEVLPAAESHVRELLKLDNEDDRAKVWQEVVAATPNQSGIGVTAKKVKSFVEKYEALKNRTYIVLDDWLAMSPADQEQSWVCDNTGKTFNKQDTGSIEWAQWSWNPITGCKHECPYCYARDIAERFYAHKFTPTLHPERFYIPENTKVPEKAETDTRYKNVFTCSMADLFGRWVPTEWIQAVLDTIEDNSQWNFLCLTKFPKRLQEFVIPENAWIGTTVDTQERVANAEKAFESIGSGIKWISVEPMLSPLKFNRLDLFDWVVIGGASSSNQTPEWRPPFEWIADLVKQCKDANCKIYFKTNLLGNRILELPFNAPIETDLQELPEAFKYLGKKL